MRTYDSTLVRPIYTETSTTATATTFLTHCIATNMATTIEFFRIEFYRIYKICRRLFLVVLTIPIYHDSLNSVQLILGN